MDELFTERAEEAMLGRLQVLAMLCMVVNKTVEAILELSHSGVISLSIQQTADILSAYKTSISPIAEAFGNVTPDTVTRGQYWDLVFMANDAMPYVVEIQNTAENAGVVVKTEDGENMVDVFRELLEMCA